MTGTNRCLDTTGGVIADSVVVIINACSGAASQKWEVLGDNTTSALIKSLGSNECLDVAGNVTANLSPVHVYQCKSSDNQLWQAQGK